MDLRIKYSIPLLVCAVLWGTCRGVAACEIPVHQYALEFWPADPYAVVVFHQGPLSDEADEAVAILREGAEHANIDLHVVAVDAGYHHLQHLAPDEEIGRTPWLVVRYPGLAGNRPVIGSGPLDLETARSWLDSPTRRKIAERLLARDAAVWILLNSGDRRKDEQAHQLLENELGRLARTLRPAALAIDPDTGGPQKIAFSVYRLDRDDPAEAPLVKMLLHSEPDLTDRDEPMAFPIFGRGLILHALVGNGINEWTLAEAAEFLVGPCSCHAKSSNPGLDLLLQVNWDALVETTSWGGDTPMVGVSEFAARAEQAERLLADSLESEPSADRAPSPAGEPSAQASEETREEAPSPRPMRPTRRPLLGGVLAIVVIWIVLKSSAKRNRGRRRR